MYPEGFVTRIDPGPIGERLDGRVRPSHFGGVATIVTKLLQQARPDVACFGEKDYQQLQVIRRIVRDLDIPVRIEGVPTIREPDGLALSSRNAYLSPAARRIAPALNRALAAAVLRMRDGMAPAAAAETARAAILAAGFDSVDYVEACDAATLLPLERLDRPGRILAAARLGTTRLIDNLPLDPGEARAR
jgi:pantoate--beta-alanine ligase